jgi:hypothetical protein
MRSGFDRMRHHRHGFHFRLIFRYGLRLGIRLRHHLHAKLRRFGQLRLRCERHLQHQPERLVQFIIAKFSSAKPKQRIQHLDADDAGRRHIRHLERLGHLRINRLIDFRHHLEVSKTLAVRFAGGTGVAVRVAHCYSLFNSPAYASCSSRLALSSDTLFKREQKSLAFQAARITR